MPIVSRRHILAGAGAGAVLVGSLRSRARAETGPIKIGLVSSLSGTAAMPKRTAHGTQEGASRIPSALKMRTAIPIATMKKIARRTRRASGEERDCIEMDARFRGENRSILPRPEAGLTTPLV